MNERPSQSGTLWSTQVHVDRWQQGDQEALGLLALRFSPLVRFRARAHSAWGSLAGRFTIDDVEQEVWARLLRQGADKFTAEESGKFAAWLGQVVDSTVIDLVRRDKAKKRGGDEQVEALDSIVALQKLRRPGGHSLLSPSGEVRLGEFEAKARQVLNERELKAWTWCVLEGYTTTEAAMGLACTSAAVRSLLLRSRSKLQEAFRAPE